MVYYSIFLATFIPLLYATGVVATGPKVTLPYATFQGVDDGNLTKFLGIPFAQPNATAFGAACPQQALNPTPAPFPLGNYTISEDCLTLNVFKPASADSKSKLPIFVWIFGGGFEVGASSDTDPRPVVERSILVGEPVIIVTPNYRVSAFGFLGGKEVSAAGVTNLGLRDQIAALEWVRDHISDFGGDPSKVVVGGVSAGAISMSYLILSNKLNTNTLFRGAFLQSGSPASTESVADGQPFYDGLVDANNCTGSSDTLACLRRVPFDALMATINRTDNIFSFTSLSIEWRPRVDGEVIVENPLLSVSLGAHSKIPIMMGDSDDEGTVFSFGNDNITTNAEFMGYIQSNYLPKSSPAQIAQITTLYPEDPAQGSPFGTGSANAITPEFKRLAAFQGDFLFVGPRRFFLEHASARQNMWSWLNLRGKTNPIIGAFHGSDSGIWFPANTTTTDTVGVNALINFINTLDPNRSARGNGAPAVFWPTWKTDSTQLLTFSDPVVVNITSDDFRSDAIQSLNELVFEAALQK
ncbi:alpha/beta-hydrolase [Mycena rosella]|uniref:Carboxylic ester hydrolase n=1 Tax=Mycena rosella TaxID=1033263 RepID=A0AAD7GQS7_MYCRO|nr:alpha/beta-hydrolase [Mycena rosella]